MLLRGVSQVIHNLNQISFQNFGTILPEKAHAVGRVNHHKLPLTADTLSLYQTAAQTWLSFDTGLALLSVSLDNVTFTDFYLDKPVMLRSGIWFSLTAIRESATVQMAGISLPRLVETKRNPESFVVRPELTVERLYACFYREMEQGFMLPGQTHKMMLLMYVDQGSLHSVAEGVDRALEQGDLVLYGPGQWHMQYADIGVAPRCISASFDVSGVDLTPIINRTFHASQKVKDLLQQILQEQERADALSGDMLLSLLKMLLITLLREVDVPGAKLQPSHSVNNENEIINRAQQYISAHVREKMSVPLVARSVDVSTSYLTALFHKHLQIAPGEYIRRVKLQESKQMIREGNMNFTQIAAALQYSTIHQFSRQFKEKFGITPTEYAKSVR